MVLSGSAVPAERPLTDAAGRGTGGSTGSVGRPAVDGRPYARLMEEHREASVPPPSPAALLMLARELRDAAVRAGRTDVAARADEAIALITTTNRPAGTEKVARDGDKANVVVRVLDGLGL